MPNSTRGRRHGSREPHVRPLRAEPSRVAAEVPGAGPTGRSVGALKTPAGIGIAIVALVAVAIAVFGLAGAPTRNPNSVAVAGATTLPAGSSAAAALGGSPALSPAPTASTAPTPAPTPSSTPAPTATPAPTPTASPSPSPRDPLLGVPVARLTRAVQAWRAKTGVPGVSVAIIWDDGRAWTGASGKADLEAGRAMTTDTGFAFASVSKMFTSAVVQQLIRDGKVGLDHSASTYLPAYHLDPRITVRMLLDHRSSLPDFFMNAKIDKALQKHKSATWTPAQTWKYVPKWRPTPGTIYDYSNTNYLLLGELVEHVTGNPLSVEVRKRILDPLKLATAWYQGAETPRVDGAVGYRGGGSTAVRVAKPSTMMPFRSVVTAAAGAGSIAGTATDAARFVAAYATGRLQGEHTFHEMVADSKYTKAMRAIVTYGLGVQVITIEGQRTLGHSGRYLGFQNTVRYLRDKGIAIAILTNQSQTDPAKLMHTLIRIVAPR